MKRNHSISDDTFNTKNELFRQVAFHEAGHAVAIYLRNKQQQLPPVFFQIALLAHGNSAIEHNDVASVIGGRLLENLSWSLSDMSTADKPVPVMAIEADVINLLAGPLAEAKYVAMRDGEAFSRHLVNLDALEFYGGGSDLEVVNQYIQYVIENSQQCSEKLDQLFIEAFRFIDSPRHWSIINALATHIIHSTKTVISCEEVIDVIENTLRDFNRTTVMWLNSIAPL